ncbi:MAG: hypothetical protein MMC33_000790 [Icmadophila ericetorum]|nr:hypothetical protein [Icmadophila ericetorum]
MLCRRVARAPAEKQWQNLILPTTFLLPFQARLTTISNFTESDPPPESLQNAGVYSQQSKTLSPLSRQQILEPSSLSQHVPNPSPPSPTSTEQSAINSSSLSESIKSLLPLLRAQPHHYITAHIHARPYLLTEGDTLRLPFHMPHVRPGDVLRLNRASTIGSRDYTLKGAPYLDEKLFECRATVLGTESEPMRFIEKKKQRNRRVKTVKAKLRFTVLKVKQVRIRSLEEVEAVRLEN